jgi:hypothetical protein
MAHKKKKIEFYRVEMMTMENLPSQLTFEQILNIPEILNISLPIKGKDVELKILRNNDDYIVGMLETNRDANVPPKKHKQNRTFDRIGLIDEGLAYGNVFLYDKRRRILMYEVNKFGCYLDHFVNFIYLALRECESEFYLRFRVKFGAILTHDEYNRIMNFGFHKSIEVEIAHPELIIADFEHQNNALFNAINSGRELNSTKVFTKFEVEARPNRGEGLSNMNVRELLDTASRLLQGRNNGNIKKIVVSGYDQDARRLKKIDLVADRYLKTITLDEPREHINLLEAQRRDQIIMLFDNCQADFDRMFAHE